MLADLAASCRQPFGDEAGEIDASVRSLRRVRREYAEALRKLSGARSDAVVEAFASVAREDYLGPGPWQIFSIPGGYRPTPDADAAHLYANILVGIEPEKHLNNGEPSLHMRLIDAMNPRPGERVVHIGCGTGYYTAIIAELVGRSGNVTAIEIEGALAERARRYLSLLPWVQVLHGNGAEVDFAPANGIYVNAGASHPVKSWLDALLPDGRLILPLTGSGPWALGGVLLIKRVPEGYEARFVSPVIIFPCAGGRSDELARLLDEAFRRGRPADVRSLRRDAHEREAGCWLHAPDYCLSVRPPTDT